MARLRRAFVLTSETGLMVWGICQKCRKRVPAEHEIREGTVFLKKNCPDCGWHETVVSTDAAIWQSKRDLCQYDPADAEVCTLNCLGCKHDHKPRLLFLDVTSRCNLNCPICIANIPGMRVAFDPPLGYFEKIFDQISTWEPPPRVELFGGEPTCRKDMFEIIAMARKRGLALSLVTNGLALADEAYCKKVCDANIDMLFAFDGRDPEIYRKMRGSSHSYARKMQAIENMKKHSRRRHTFVCTLARGVNDQHMKDHLQFMHENRRIVRRLFFIPLTEMWDAGVYEAPQITTPEDVEHIIQDVFPGEPVEFIPANVFGHLLPALKFFGTERIRFAGVHPNCECATFLVSDGETYQPASRYLKRSLKEIAAEVVTRAKKVNPKLARLDRKRWSHRWRGRMIALRAYGGLALGALNYKKVFKGSPALRMIRVMGGLMIGRSFEDLVRKHTHLQDTMPLVILPFEEWHSLESGRMKRCTAGFVYLDPDTDRVATVPFCMWCHYRKDMYIKINRKYPPQTTVASSVEDSTGR